MISWHPFGRGFQATVRAPYHDLEVVPFRGGWTWRTLAMDSRSGSFREVASGRARELERAKALSMSAATVGPDWNGMIEATLELAGLTGADLNAARRRIGSVPLGGLDNAGLEACYRWLVDGDGIDAVRAAPESRGR